MIGGERMRRFVVKVACVGAVAAGWGCADTLYVLPDPPPEGERRSVSLIPGEDERLKEQDYIAARASALKLYQLLSTKRFEEAIGLMSQETRDFLVFVSPGDKNALTTLEEGKMKFPDGTLVVADPVEVLLSADMSDLKDEVEGEEEQEGVRRKEIWAQSEGKKPRKIVMIKEGGKWVLHRTSVKPEDL
jgi:hypothetical protein